MRPATKSLVLMCALARSTLPGMAHEFPAGAISISHPWSRVTPPAAAVAAGYLTITNIGTKPDRLLSVESSWATRVEIHQSTVEDGVAKVRPVVGGLDVASGQSIALQPGGLHMMFIEPDRGFVAGDRVPARLRFAKAGVVEIGFLVLGADQQAPVDKPRSAQQSSGQ
ncbi:copper chaperone PCu(A)C [Mesorhizobium comanense]|uniref:copper chaperone PCu(A)C n=1 Tax=Mesorhizobium comanense TaxID=2502215 RepID=UPI0010F7D6E0|nr:copper chaperone PCu(A)C [Mesorhizobium comanense]